MEKKFESLINYFFERKINTISREAGDILRLIAMSKFIDNTLVIGGDIGLSPLYIKSAIPNAWLDMVGYFTDKRSAFIKRIFDNCGLRFISTMNGNVKSFLGELKQYDLVYIHLEDDRDYYGEYLKELFLGNHLLKDCFIVIYTEKKLTAETTSFLADKCNQIMKIENANLLIAKIK